MKRIFLMISYMMFIAGITSIGFASPPNTGEVGIAADQVGAWIYLNGEKKGMIGDDGFTNIVIKEGEYELLIEKPIEGSPLAWSSTRKVFVGEGTSIRLNFKLDKGFARSELANINTHIKEMTNSIDMQSIPEGVLIMGSEVSFDEKPVHEVNIPAFKMSATEVTFDQYDIFAVMTQRKLPDDHSWGRGQRPAINVSWVDAKAFINWLNEMVQPEKPFRLPTEAEWEYASRAGSDTHYWWGDQIDRNKANCYACGSEWDNRQTAPVSSFSANPFGLYDTVGNVWEWVEDCWSSNYNGAPSDGSAWFEGDCQTRVLRGGAWYYNPRGARSATRSYHTAEHSYNHFGFRLAQDF